MLNVLEILRVKVYFGNQWVDMRIILKWTLVYNDQPRGLVVRVSDY
jgi:hypothetical protein